MIAGCGHGNKNMKNTLIKINIFITSLILILTLQACIYIDVDNFDYEWFETTVRIELVYGEPPDLQELLVSITEELEIELFLQQLSNVNFRRPVLIMDYEVVGFHIILLFIDGTSRAIGSMVSIDLDINGNQARRFLASGGWGWIDLWRNFYDVDNDDRWLR